eukprot:295191_1
MSTSPGKTEEPLGTERVQSASPPTDTGVELITSNAKTDDNAGQITTEDTGIKDKMQQHLHDTQEKGAQDDGVEELCDLYYICSEDKISGPHYPCDILKLYGVGQIKNVFWVVHVNDVENIDDLWCKVDVSSVVSSTASIEKDDDLKGKYPALYQYCLVKTNLKHYNYLQDQLRFHRDRKRLYRGESDVFKPLVMY